MRVLRLIKLSGYYLLWIPLLLLEVIFDWITVGAEWITHMIFEAERRIEIKALNVKHNHKGRYYSRTK